LLILVGIILAATLPNLINEIQKSNPGMMDSNNPMMRNQNYRSNPYQTQGNSSLTASQMGMSDKEHAEMHDPKNIVNTDYSQLDYSNVTDADIKKAEDAAMKAMDSMTPEQKAAMEKMMSEIKK
jgi:hypothetical protein